MKKPNESDAASDEVDPVEVIPVVSVEPIIEEQGRYFRVIGSGKKRSCIDGTLVSQQEWWQEQDRLWRECDDRKNKGEPTSPPKVRIDPNKKDPVTEILRREGLIVRANASKKIDIIVTISHILEILTACGGTLAGIMCAASGYGALATGISFGVGGGSFLLLVISLIINYFTGLSEVCCNREKRPTALAKIDSYCCYALEQCSNSNDIRRAFFHAYGYGIRIDAPGIEELFSLAIKEDNVEVVALLLYLEANSDNALSKAIEWGSHAVLELLLHSGIEPNQAHLTAAINGSDIAATMLLLETGIATSIHIETALHIRNRAQRAEIIRLLLDKNIAPEHKHIRIALSKYRVNSPVYNLLKQRTHQRSVALPISSAPAIGEDGSHDAGYMVSASYIIPYSALRIGRRLGSGGFGDVFVGDWQKTTVAIKQLQNQQMSGDTVTDFKREASMMTKLHHPNVLQLYGVCIEPGHYSLVMEYMPKGSLYSVLNSGERLSWPQKWEIAIKISTGLYYLHARNIIHRDLKSMNVLVGEGLSVKICDFGLSRVRPDAPASIETDDGVGTERWMAPELFKENPKYTKAADVYSLAILLWELITHDIPFSTQRNAVAVMLVQQGQRPQMPADAPSEFAGLVVRCWAQRRKDRPPVEEVVEELERTQGEAVRY